MYDAVFCIESLANRLSPSADPWHVPKQFADLYDQDDIKLPNISAQHAPVKMVPWAFDKGLDGLTHFQILNSSAQGGSCDVPVNGPNNTMPPWAFQAMRKGYYSALSWSDHLVGMMLSKMDELDVTSSTVTILTSDQSVPVSFPSVCAAAIHWLISTMYYFSHSGYHLGEGGLW